MAFERLWPLAVGAILGSGMPPHAVGAMLEPHRATYVLSLVEGPGPSVMAEVEGGLAIEWESTCDAWLSRQRLAFRGLLETGEGFLYDVRFSSWEAIDGTELRFSVRSFEGETLVEEYRGSATNAQGDVRAAFTRPETEDVALPSETIFPTQHLLAVMASATAGEGLVDHTVFDGWGFDALTTITSVIGAERSHGTETDDGGQVQVWPVSMAYYDAIEADATEPEADTPDFEAGFLLGADGVLRDLELDYGDFRLEARLDGLEFLTPPGC